MVSPTSWPGSDAEECQSAGGGGHYHECALIWAHLGGPTSWGGHPPVNAKAIGGNDFFEKIFIQSPNCMKIPIWSRARRCRLDERSCRKNLAGVLVSVANESNDRISSGKFSKRISEIRAFNEIKIHF